LRLRGRTAVQLGVSSELRPGLDFSERALDLGPRLDLSRFDVVFRVGGLSVNNRTSGAAVDFSLGNLDNPSDASFWQSSGRLCTSTIRSARHAQPADMSWPSAPLRMAAACLTATTSCSSAAS